MRGRTRTIKPEIFSDEILGDLEQDTGLPVFRAFVGLWCVADREGRFEWSPRALRGSILPCWNGDMRAVLEALASKLYIVRYTVGGKDYGYIRTFNKHQPIHKNEAPSVLPNPEAHGVAEFQGITGNSGDQTGGSGKWSPGTPDVSGSSTSTSSSSSDPTSGSTSDISSSPPAASVDPSAAPPVAPPPDTPPAELEPEAPLSELSAVRDVFAAWQRVHGHTTAKLDAKRSARIRRALKLFTPDQLEQAIRGAVRDDWLMGRDPKSPRKYDGLETILRDTAQIERLIALERAGPAPRSRTVNARASSAKDDAMNWLLEAANGSAEV
jgi:hypothetical protein